MGLQRVYEYAVEPSVLQSLPDNVLLVPAPAGQVQAVECDPEIVTLPRVSPVPLDEAVPRRWEAARQSAEKPQLVARSFQPRWPPRDREAARRPRVAPWPEQEDGPSER